MGQSCPRGSKKSGFTVVKNENKELVQTRLPTKIRVCIDYRKLNVATHKEHFSLPFIDQILERLAGHEYYCFLDSFSGYNQIPIVTPDPWYMYHSFSTRYSVQSWFDLFGSQIKPISVSDIFLQYFRFFRIFWNFSGLFCKLSVVSVDRYRELALRFLIHK